MNTTASHTFYCDDHFLHLVSSFRFPRLQLPLSCLTGEGLKPLKVVAQNVINKQIETIHLGDYSAILVEAQVKVIHWTL